MALPARRCAAARTMRPTADATLKATPTCPGVVVEGPQPGKERDDEGMASQDVEGHFVDEPPRIEAWQFEPPRPTEGPRRVPSGHGDHRRQPEENPGHLPLLTNADGYEPENPKDARTQRSRRPFVQRMRHGDRRQRPNRPGLAADELRSCSRRVVCRCPVIVLVRREPADQGRLQACVGRRRLRCRPRRRHRPRVRPGGRR